MRHDGTDPVRDDMPGVLKHREAVKRYRMNNLEKVTARDKQYREANKSRITAVSRERYIRDHDKIRAKQKLYEETHRAERSERNAAYYAAHTQERKEYIKRYNEEHKEQIRIKAVLLRERRKVEIAWYREHFKPVRNLKNKISRAIKNGLDANFIADLKMQLAAAYDVFRAQLREFNKQRKAEKQQGGNLGSN